MRLARPRDTPRGLGQTLIVASESSRGELRNQSRLVTVRKTLGIAAGASLLAAAMATVAILSIARPHRWGLGVWLSDFAKSPGLAGICAVAAASLALWGILRQVKVSQAGLEHQRSLEQDRSWWTRFEWAATRALPSSPEDKALPYPAVLTVLTALLEGATNEVQRTAVGAIIDVAARTSNDTAAHTSDDSHGSPTPAAETLASDSVADSSDDMQRLLALQLYSAASANTSARSSTVEAQLYEASVYDALHRIFGPENVTITPALKIDGRVVRPDAIVDVQDRRVLVEVKAFRRPNALLGRTIEGKVAELAQLAGADASVVVAPTDLRVSDIGIENGLSSVRWEDANDDEALRNAIASARRPLL